MEESRVAPFGRLGIPHGTGARFWVAGRISKDEYVDKEGAGVLFLAWRCLYADVVQARINDRSLRLRHTYARLILMTISRLKANGQKWYQWYSRIRKIRQQRTKYFPKRFRTRKLVRTERDASYTINPILYKEFEDNKRYL